MRKASKTTTSIAALKKRCMKDTGLHTNEDVLTDNLAVINEYMVMAVASIESRNMIHLISDLEHIEACAHTLADILRWRQEDHR